MASASSVPPAKPLIAAVEGYALAGGRSVKPMPRPSTMGSSPRAKAFRSIPAQKEPPAKPLIAAVEGYALASAGSVPPASA
ncbi:hypothetical protein MAHJHV29_49630 [Mycobacterium avium subsp. hominissuis]